MVTLSALVLVLLGLGFELVAIVALVRGRVPYPSAPAFGARWIERRKDPVFFWINVVLYLVIGTAVAPMGLIALF